VVGEQLHTVKLESYDDAVCHVALEPIERRASMLPVPGQSKLICASAGSVFSARWRVRDGFQTQYQYHDHHVSAWVRDEQALLGSLCSSGLVLIDTKTGASQVVDPHFGGRVHAILKLTNGTMAVASDTIKIWRPGLDPLGLDSLALVSELKGHQDEVLCLLQLPDGRLVSGAIDPTVRVWDVDVLDPAASSCVLRGHTGSVHSLAYPASGELVSGSTDQSLRVWSLSLSSCLMVLDEHKVDHSRRHERNRVNALAVLPDQRLASADDQGNLIIWE